PSYSRSRRSVRTMSGSSSTTTMRNLTAPLRSLMDQIVAAARYARYPLLHGSRSGIPLDVQNRPRARAALAIRVLGQSADADAAGRDGLLCGRAQIELASDEPGERQGKLYPVKRDALRILLLGELQLLVDLLHFRPQVGRRARGARGGAHTLRSRATASPSASPFGNTMLRPASVRM